MAGSPPSLSPGPQGTSTPPALGSWAQDRVDRGGPSFSSVSPGQALDLVCAAETLPWVPGYCCCMEHHTPVPFLRGP